MKEHVSLSPAEPGPSTAGQSDGEMGNHTSSSPVRPSASATGQSDGEMGSANFYQLLQIQAQNSPDKPLLLLDGCRYSYGQISQRARALMAPWGNIRGWTVLIHTDDWLEQLLSFFALQGAGAIPIIAHFPTARPVLDGYGIAAALMDKLYLVKQAPPAGACFGVLSSGSTGLPQLHYRTYRSWVDFYPIHNQIFALRTDTRLLLQGSLSFTGNLNAAMALLAAGGTLVAGRRLDPRRWIQWIEQANVTMVYLIPEKLHLLVAAAKGEYRQVRGILAGSQLLGSNTLAALGSHFPQADLFLYYGTSECSFITYRNIRGGEASQNVGKPFPGIGLEQRGDDLWVNTPYGIMGQPQPCPLPDQGQLLADGSLLFLGRRGNTVNRSGVQVNLTKLEQAAQSIPGVTAAAAIPYQEIGKRLRICLFYTGRIPVEALRQQLGEQILAPEKPWKLIQLEQIPLSPAGKPDEKQLRQLVATKQSL